MYIEIKLVSQIQNHMNRIYLNKTNNQDKNKNYLVRVLN